MTTTVFNKHKPAFMLLPVFILLLSSCHQQQVVVEQIPANTPAGSAIYITGNFNNWDPGDSRFILEPQGDGTYAIDLPHGFGSLEYKFTRGDWTTGETNACGYEIGNRILHYGEYAIIRNIVEAWGDTEPMNCTQKILAIRVLPPNTPKDATVYLASDFNNWNPGDLQFVFQRGAKGMYYIPIEEQTKCINYKITLGNWETVETDKYSNDIENRQTCFESSDTVFLDIQSWKSTKVPYKKKVTIVLKKLPVGTQPGDQIYLAGDMNEWNPGNRGYLFKIDSIGRSIITIASDEESMSFKITRGNWHSVETTRSGSDIPNRTFIFGQADTLYLSIDRWKDR